MKSSRGLFLTALGVAIFACSSDPSSGSGTTATTCQGLGTDFRFDNGAAPDGHADPFGAKAAGQARAGRIKDASQIVQGPTARAKVRVGDFALANDKIALYIEQENRPNGYAPFGGEILAIEPVGDDGKPTGTSLYNETLIVLSRQTIKPDKVTVINDGSDGKAAIIREQGVLTNIPFLDTFAAVYAAEYGFPAAIDYVLEPHAEKVLLRFSVANTGSDDIDFSTTQRIGFFQSNRGKLFTEANGYGTSKGANPYVAFDTGQSAFLFKAVGQDLTTDLSISGFNLFTMSGLTAKSCEKKTTDYLEITTANSNIDGVLEAKRRAYGEAAWQEVHGTLKETGGGPLAGAFIHATGADGKYLTRVVTDANGAFVIHVPAGSSLTPTLQGWAIPAATPIAGATADLVLPQRATIQVTATDATTNEALPVRVQVLPATPPVTAPEQFGLHEEINGRLWQSFAITNGTIQLPVPPGTDRVIVSRGYEYELLDTSVVTESGKTASVVAPLKHTVDTTNVMCADFHVHSWFSADASDPVDDKVKAAVADGLDIPVSSEHEWIIDFQPIVQRLGLTKWAFGMPSEELTTFTWGHFGVVPLYPKEDQTNNGAVDWVGQKPPSFFHQVSTLPEKPVFIVNHPNGSTAFQSYFVAAGLDRAKASGDPDLWSDEFGAVEVFNDSDLNSNRDKSVADYFSLLNANKTVWVVGNSDSHDQRSTFVGYPRNCMTFGHDDPTKLTPEIVRDVLRTGALTVSGGLFMSVQGPGGVGPGGTAAAGDYKVVVQSPSWFGASKLEVIVDGVSVATQPLTAITPSPNDPGKRYEATIPVAATQSRPRHWVVFHASGDGDLAPLHPTKKPFAVSNPIFF